MYLRFLFRLGDRREEGHSLYESFEALLEELGYQIEFVADGERAQEIDGDHAADGLEGFLTAQARDFEGLPRRSRRASFHSTYDAEDESTRAFESRPRSRASMSRLDISQRSLSVTRPSTRATTRKTEKTSFYASPAKGNRVQATRGRLTAEEFAKSSHLLQQNEHATLSKPSGRRQQRAASKDSRIKRSAGDNNSLVDISQHAATARSTGGAALAVGPPIQPLYTVGQHEMLYNPSRTQLLRDAETFHHYRIRSVARDVVDKWCYAALQSKDQHGHLDRLAAAYDTEILLRQAFEHWRLRLHAKKQAADIERYFNHQERRATRARDLMLLSKAFTHWAQCAFEERLRTSNARQKILSIKYFHAWHDITIANQRSVRHQGLRKYFAIWKRHHVRRLTDDNKANMMCHEGIAKKAYWHWFWAFCEGRAPEWRAGQLRRKYLTDWIAASRKLKRQYQYLTIQSESSTRHRILSHWFVKAQSVVSTQQEAINFRRYQEATHALQSWRRCFVYLPLTRQISNMIDWRVAGTNFAIMISRYRFVKQARAVSQSRTMRNAWTQWNDRLRRQIVARRIDDRACLEALYRWVIVERQILLQRLSEERLKQRLLHKLRSEYVARHVERTRSCQIIEDKRRKLSLQYVLAHWRSQLNFLYQDEHVAFEFHAPKLAQESLQLWTGGLKHLQKLNDLAKDANFYFTSKKTMRVWHVALLESQKQKRKTAYKQVRRRLKISLAKTVLQHWHEFSSRTQAAHEQADLVDRNRLFEVGTKLFDQWVNQYSQRREQNHQASQHYHRRLLERHMYTWIERLEDQSRYDDLADINYDMHLKNVAFGWLNRLRLKIIELKGQEANAENLKSWYEKRHFRSILRQWQDKRLKRLNPSEEIASSARVIGAKTRAPTVYEGATNRAEDWTDFEIEDWIPALEAESSSTPLPGYLSTPSKRAARARALVKVSTTPVGTPFERRLRTQAKPTPRTARRVGFGRSVSVQRGNTFGAILEDSPKTPT